MAIIKEKTVKGIVCNYNMIHHYTSAKPNSTHVTVYLYPSAEIRSMDIENYLETYDISLAGYGINIVEVYEKLNEILQGENDI